MDTFTIVLVTWLREDGCVLEATKVVYLVDMTFISREFLFYHFVWILILIYSLTILKV